MDLSPASARLWVLWAPLWAAGAPVPGHRLGYQASLKFSWGILSAHLLLVFCDNSLSCSLLVVTKVWRLVWLALCSMTI